MFQTKNYDVIDILPPKAGMNTNVSEEALSQDFATKLENMLPFPQGSLSMRFGTELFAELNLDADCDIMEAFPFTKTDGTKQVVLYVRNFVKDPSVNNVVVLEKNSFSFFTSNSKQYLVDTPLKILVVKGGIATEYVVATNVQEAGANQILLTVDRDILSENARVESVFFSKSFLYVYDFSQKSLTLLKENLAVDCVPRSVTFLNTLLICNGVDRVLSWDGDRLAEVVDFVKEDSAGSFQRINDTQFSFGLSPLKASLFDIEKYENANKIQLKINGVTTTLEVSNVSKAQDQITITTSINLPNFDGQTQPELFYRDWPPCFSFMAVAHNRLWGLGSGACGLSYRMPSEAMRVYFSHQSNAIDQWFNETTKTVPSINLANTHDIPDNLEAIAQYGPYMAFMGREKAQVWTGSEPLGGQIDPSKPALEFSSVLPVGLVHGNLFLKMANDITFVSQNGVTSFSTLNLAKQFAASPIDAVNPLVRECIQSINGSNIAYRSCRSFKYQSGSFCGFKIGFNKPIVSLFSTNVYAWSVFSGDFFKATTFLSESDGHLYLFLGKKILRYADKTTPTLIYGDDGGKSPVHGVWETPAIGASGRRFANKRFEILCKYSSAFALDPKNAIVFEVDGMSRKTFSIDNEYFLPLRGDNINEVALVKKEDIGSDPNNPNENAQGLRLDIPYSSIKTRMKFVSSTFRAKIICSTINSPLQINRIRLLGVLERNT